VGVWIISVNLFMCFSGKIGQRADDCNRKSVLNCIAEYPANWAPIGECLIGLEEIEKIKKESLLPGDEVAYLVEQWWRQTYSPQFSWKVLQEAIERMARSKYRQIEQDTVAYSTAKENDSK